MLWLRLLRLERHYDTHHAHTLHPAAAAYQLKKYFTFEVTVLDDKNVHRRFRASNYQSTTRVKPFICTMPMRLDEGWNQIQFNLSDFTRRAYGTNYIETLRVQIHANCRIRRIYFSDRLYSEEELPAEFKLFLPIGVSHMQQRQPYHLPCSPSLHNHHHHHHHHHNRSKPSRVCAVEMGRSSRVALCVCGGSCCWVGGRASKGRRAEGQAGRRAGSEACGGGQGWEAAGDRSLHPTSTPQSVVDSSSPWHVKGGGLHFCASVTCSQSRVAGVHMCQSSPPRSCHGDG